MNPIYEGVGNVVRNIYDARLHGPPVLDMATEFPAGSAFVAAWEGIRDEARDLARQLHKVPRFHDVMRQQADISANDARDWRIFILKAYGVELAANMAACPKLASLITANPEVLSASISFLAPRKHIPEHRGPFRGVLRFYLVLSMPLAADGRPAAALTVDGIEHRLNDGEYLLWDDTYPHEVTNASDEVRTVLLLDVWRPGMPLDMRLLSRAVIGLVGTMVRVRGMA